MQRMAPVQQNQQQNRTRWHNQNHKIGSEKMKHILSPILNKMPLLSNSMKSK